MVRLLLVVWSLLANLTPVQVVEKAGALFDENRWRETVDVINESLTDVRASGDTDNLAECLSMLSIAYFRLGAFSSAWDAQWECYQLDLASGDAGNISSSLNTLAGICLAMENYEEGERLIREAIRYEEPLGESAALAVRYGMASDILLKQGTTQEAIAFAEKALAIDTAAGRPVQTAIRQSQLAAAYIEAGRLPDARKLLDAAASTFGAVQDLHSLAVCRQQQGMIAAKQGDFRQSAHYLREGLTLSRQTGELLLQRNISQDLAVVLKDADPRSAVGYMQDVVVLSDTLFRQEMSHRMAELAIRNDLALKEHEIAAQQDALRTDRRRLVALGAVAALLLAATVLLLFRLASLRRQNRTLQEASALKDKMIAMQSSDDPAAVEEQDRLRAMLKDMGFLPEKLTVREREIALLCSQGLSNKEVAERLNLSPRTVETHKNNIFRKLGINSTAELVGLISKS